VLCSIGTIATAKLAIQYCLTRSVRTNRPIEISVTSSGACRARQYHRHDRVCRRLRSDRRVHRPGLAQQPGEHARQESRREQQAADCRVDCRRCEAAVALSYRTAAAWFWPRSKRTSRCSRSRSPVRDRRWHRRSARIRPTNKCRTICAFSKRAIVKASPSSSPLANVTAKAGHGLNHTLPCY
jgi:hypothetical protein